MAQLTPAGLLIRRFPEIQSAIELAIQQQTATSLSFDPDLILGHIVSILSAEFTVFEQALQALYDAKDRDKASGTALDALLYLVGLTRIGQSKTSGDLKFTTENDTTIPIGYISENPSTRDRYVTTEAHFNTVSNCIEAVFEIAVALPEDASVTLTVNSADYTVIAAAGATNLEVTTALKAAIDLDTAATWSATLEGEFIVITTTGTSNLDVSSLQYLEPVRTVGLVPAEAQEAGMLYAPAETITAGISPLSALISVTNVLTFGTGRERETDTEFRIRAAKSLAVSGSATYAALLASLLNLDEITAVNIVENATSSIDSSGVPAHAFEVIIDAPDTDDIDQIIANTIWLNKPIGIEAFGNREVVIKDASDTDRNVSFSRPASIVMALRITYTLYDEEPLTEEADTLIRNSVTVYGNSLIAGKDIIPKRFYDSVYRVADGLDEVTVEVQQLDATGDVPDTGAWVETKIAIAGTEHGTFNVADVTMVGP